ncbi:MAG: porin family protein [Pseudomonadota bacterium]
MLSCLIAITAFSTQSYAQDKKLYLSAYLGLNTIEDQDYSNSAVPVNGEIESDSAVSFAGALGFRLNRSIRVEAEVGYSSSDLSSINTNAGSGPLNGDMEALTFMLSGYSDFDLDWPVVPYIGAGAGFGLFDSNIRDGGSGFTQNSSGDDWSFIYQVGGGLKYHMSEDMSLSGGYRYIGASDIEFDQTDVDYSAHEFRFGLHYDLPISWDE